MVHSSAPPFARIQTVVDSCFGTSVNDPYRYMEDFSDAPVQQWIKSQADYTDHVLNQLPMRDALFERMMELEGYALARLQNVTQLLDYIFYLKRGADEDVWKLYMRKGLEGTESLLVDPTLLADRGQNACSIS